MVRRHGHLYRRGVYRSRTTRIGRINEHAPFFEREHRRGVVRISIHERSRVYGLAKRHREVGVAWNILRIASRVVPIYAPRPKRRTEWINHFHRIPATGAPTQPKRRLERVQYKLGDGKRRKDDNQPNAGVGKHLARLIHALRIAVRRHPQVAAVHDQQRRDDAKKTENDADNASNDDADVFLTKPRGIRNLRKIRNGALGERGMRHHKNSHSDHSRRGQQRKDTKTPDKHERDSPPLYRIFATPSGAGWG